MDGLANSAWRADRANFSVPAPACVLCLPPAAFAYPRQVDAERVAEFLPSLYVNLGRAYELTGDAALAERHYELAAELGLVHQVR